MNDRQMFGLLVITICVSIFFWIWIGITNDASRNCGRNHKKLQNKIST